MDTVVPTSGPATQRPLDEIVCDDSNGKSDFYRRHPVIDKAVTGGSYVLVGYGIAVLSTVLLPAYFLGRGLYRVAKWQHDKYAPETPFEEWNDSGKWPWQKGYDPTGKKNP